MIAWLLDPGVTHIDVLRRAHAVGHRVRSQGSTFCFKLHLRIAYLHPIQRHLDPPPPPQKRVHCPSSTSCC